MHDIYTHARVHAASTCYRNVIFDSLVAYKRVEI